jgi:hypothetical protein
MVARSSSMLSANGGRLSASMVSSMRSALWQSYRINKATGDRYAGDVIADMFRKRSLPYDPTDYNESDLYHDLLPFVEYRSHCAAARAQIVGLERRVGSSGRDSISHVPGGHDDVANAVAGVAKLVHQKRVFVRPRSTRLDWL